MLATELEEARDLEHIEPETRFVDIGFDSLSLVGLAALIAELSGADEFVWTADVETVRDAYTWYCTAMNWPRGES
ncbi:MAG: acyl carrier protein [Acidimicrobiales bacterium]